MRTTFFTGLLLFAGLLSSCNRKESPPTLFRLMDNTGIEFTNHIHNTPDFNIFSYRNFYNGGGVAIGDIDNDGLADVFFTANMERNRLYLNKGDWKFEDVTDKAGFRASGKWGTGVVMADVNADGWLDIYVCYAGYQQGISQDNELYINNRNGTFSERAKEYGLNETGYTTHAAFFDYDLDGDLDCYVLKNSFIPVNTLNYANKRDLRSEDWPVADFLKGGGDKLLRNEGGKFVDVSKEAGIYGSLIGFGLGVTVGDLNGDYYPDIYISNDFFERDYLYINRQDGTFSEELESRMQHVSHSSMGADIGDINNDGYPDVFTTDMLPHEDERLKTTTSFENIEINRLKVRSGFYYQYMQNTLQVNNRSGKFLESAYYSGVAASDWSWGGLIFDADNDGWSDIFVCNGINHDVTDQDFIEFFANDVIQNMVMTGQKSEVDQIVKKMPSNPIPNRAFRNLGGLRFQDEAAAWGLAQPSFSNGAAYGDLDNDGDLDLVVNNVNQSSFVYRNESRERPGNHYVGLTLKGRSPNVFAIGSTVKLYRNGSVISREVIPSRGFQSSVDYKVLIGLGKESRVDSLQIIWPDRTVSRMLHPTIDRVHTVQQEGANPLVSDTGGSKPSPLLQPLAASFMKHAENDYTDFYEERGVPVMLSAEGPRVAHGDVNGDGRTDVYIGGAAFQPGQLYLQTAAGFSPKKVAAFEQHALFEDVAAVFFDCDGDGDLDLVAGSGGNERPAGSAEYRNRLYRNDGRGNFTYDPASLPESGMNTSVLSPHDIDGDGDQDLFAGSRSQPKNYGATPASHMYLNDGSGKFAPLPDQAHGGLQQAGMITAAAWTDVQGDSRKELVVVGDWMSPKTFSFDGSRFREVKTGLENLSGWWQSLRAADLDGDGDEDLVIGNLGENFYLRPGPDKPVRLWMNDFDGNGTTEKIFTQTVNGKDKPVFLKKDLSDQIASLRKQNFRYSDFAGKSIQELFPEEDLKKSQVKVFNYAASIIALNEGGGKFTIRVLPVEVQLSSIHAIHCTDVNGDGHPDLILGGNHFGFLPQFSRLDASYGHVLLNDGRAHFTAPDTQLHGLELRGCIRDMAEIKTGKGRLLLVVQNNEVPALYQITPAPGNKRTAAR